MTTTDTTLATDQDTTSPAIEKLLDTLTAIGTLREKLKVAELYGIEPVAATLIADADTDLYRAENLIKRALRAAEVAATSNPDRFPTAGLW